MAKAAKKKAPIKKKPATKTAELVVVPRLTQRQAAFIEAYTNKESPTFDNAYASALAAGYSESYARNITVIGPEKISETIGTEERVAGALAHIDEVLEMPIVHQAMGAFGPLYEKKETFVEKPLKKGGTRLVKKIQKVPVMTINTTRIKEKTKVAEMTLGALRKDQWGKQQQDKGNTFIFNMKQAKQRYLTPQDDEPVHAEARPA